MNTLDEECRLPPPPACLSCRRIERWMVGDVERARCSDLRHLAGELCDRRVPTLDGIPVAVQQAVREEGPCR